MKEVILDLACVLDEAEVNDRAQQLSSTVVRRDEVDTEKRNVTKGYNERLSELEGKIRSLSKVIRERAEFRPVTCAVQFHKPAQGTKRIVRKDTGEIVRDEPMSSFEHQNNLFEERADEVESSVDGAAEQSSFAAQLEEIGAPILAKAVRSVDVANVEAVERATKKSKRKPGQSATPNGFDSEE